MLAPTLANAMFTRWLQYPAGRAFAAAGLIYCFVVVLKWLIALLSSVVSTILQ